jgi:ribosomal protein S18 acetylase RimI-like enzyme
MKIRAATPSDEDRIAELSLQAWAPVFASMREVVGGAIFRLLFTDDWRRYQEDDVRRACRAYDVGVAEVDGEVVGFTAVDQPKGEPHGEIYMIAVKPSHQRQGVGRRLTEWAVNTMRAAGRELAIVRTGSDAGHAPARATYESAGFVSLPGEQYFLALDGAGHRKVSERSPGEAD